MLRQPLHRVVLLIAALSSLRCVQPKPERIKSSGLLTKRPEPGSADAARVIELTEDNFDQMLRSGEPWFIVIAATWCGHCKQLQPALDELAKALKDTDIRVGKIDGPRNRVLMARFGVQAFPSLYLLHGGRTYPYEGSRALQSLKEWAQHGYMQTGALPMLSTRSPNGLLGPLMALVHSVPPRLARTYKVLREEHGHSDLGLVAMLLACPVLVGLATICLMDAWMHWGARRAGAQPPPPPLAPPVNN